MSLLKALQAKFRIPGWVHLQVNGHAGICFFAEDLSVEEVSEATGRLAEAGTAGFLATVVTSPPSVMEHCLSVLGRACEDKSLSKHLLGIHLEGPFLSPEPGARGAHPSQCMLAPSIDRFNRFQDLAGGHIRILTLAPELSGAIPLIEKISGTVA